MAGFETVRPATMEAFLIAPLSATLHDLKWQLAEAAASFVVGVDAAGAPGLLAARDQLDGAGERAMFGTLAGTSPLIVVQAGLPLDAVALHLSALIAEHAEIRGAVVVDGTGPIGVLARDTLLAAGLLISVPPPTGLSRRLRNERRKARTRAEKAARLVVCPGGDLYQLVRARSAAPLQCKLHPAAIAPEPPARTSNYLRDLGNIILDNTPYLADVRLPAWWTTDAAKRDLAPYLPLDASTLEHGQPLGPHGEAVSRIVKAMRISYPPHESMQSQDIIGYVGHETPTRSDDVPVKPRDSVLESAPDAALESAMESQSESITDEPPPATTPARLTRYCGLDGPDQTPIDVPFSLQVLLTVAPPAELPPGVTLDQITADIEDTGQPDSPPTVDLLIRAHGFTIQGSNTRTITVWRNEDVRRRFVLTPHRLGPQSISVDIYQGDRYLVTATHRVDVQAADVRDETPATVAPPTPAPGPVALTLTAGAGVPPPDLEVGVAVHVGDDDLTTLSFTLHSRKPPGTYHLQSAGRVELRTSLMSQTSAVYAELSKMARNDPSSDEARRVNTRRLAAIGNDLWKRFVSPELKEQFWRFRGAVSTLQVTSEEPWIPWEMVKPFREPDDADREDADFWCQSFKMTRWLRGTGSPTDLPVGTAYPVAPTSTNLAAVKQEVELIGRLSSLRADIVASSQIESVLDVQDLFLTGTPSILHFACHGQFDPTTPGDSGIKLAGGLLLRPSDLQGTFGGRRPRPLVFINACHGGRQAEMVTGVGGWARRMVDAKVGAFVGAAWEVEDSLALLFATVLYEALLKPGTTIVDAFSQAREEVRKKRPYNSTWLAYVLYADPRAQLVSAAPPTA